MPSKTLKIAPSILSANFAELKKDIQMVTASGAEWLHLDIMDGHFVDNLTIGPVVIESIRKESRLFFDAHLMIENPEKYIDDFAKAGSDLICVHLETLKDPSQTLDRIKKLGVKVGLAVNPDKKFEMVKPFINQIDMVLFMSVFPGFAGQSFIPEVLVEIKKCREHINTNRLPIDIEIDGGINKQTIGPAVEAGANIIVSGSAIFKAENPAEVIRHFLSYSS